MGLVAPRQWDLYVLGTEPMFPVLAGRCFTTEPPGKPAFVHFLLELWYYYTDFRVTEIKGICVTEIKGNYIQPQIFLSLYLSPSLSPPHTRDKQMTLTLDGDFTIFSRAENRTLSLKAVFRVN